ncbi:RodZ domain-containing protein [Novosphingobium sp.]|uniref:helix-turn-helix domain-containing protein n=1 Tax=Novosphingobium sp. TaxID=1874826 RepID=UPI00286A651B|nr:RodZ domain-containing protein [Novosphingobium sp.]
MSDEITEAAAVELPLETVGSRLRRTREAAGLSLAQVAAETRIGERQLKAIEDGNYAALPGRTYAIGFSRAFARMLGLNEIEVTDAVRRELAEHLADEPRRHVQTFEPGDPARLPSARLAWLAAGLIVLAVISALFVWPTIFAPAGDLGTQETEAAPATAAAADAAGAAVAVPQGPVVFAALVPAVWVKLTDDAGNQVFQKELAQGETFTVPTDKGEVYLRTARPEALAITIGGQPVPKISDLQQTVSQVPVSAAALLARGSGAAPASPAAVIADAPTGSTNAAAATRPQPRRSAAPRDTQRTPRPRVEASPAPADLPVNAPATSATAPAPGAT